MNVVNVAARLIRVAIALGLGVVAAGSVPVWEEPFGGCSEGGFTSFAMGCTYWDAVLTGFLLVVPAAVIAPRKCLMPVVLVTFLFLVSLVGGVRGVRMGSHLDGGPFPVSWWHYPDGYLHAIGGGVVLVSWLLWPWVRSALRFDVA